MEKQEAIKKLEETVGAYLLSGKADNTTCGEWREILETLKRDDTCKGAISRKAAKDAIENAIAKYIPTFIGSQQMIPLELAVAIKKVHSVRPIIAQGEWIREWKTQFNGEDYDEYPYYRCSKCGRIDFETYNFCSGCGAKMEGLRDGT